MKKLYSDGEFQKLMVEQFGLVHKEIGQVKSEIVEIKDILYPLAKAFDIDSQTVVDHGRRLTRVEGHLGLQ